MTFYIYATVYDGLQVGNTELTDVSFRIYTLLQALGCCILYTFRQCITRITPNYLMWDQPSPIVDIAPPRHRNHTHAMPTNSNGASPPYIKKGTGNLIFYKPGIGVRVVPRILYGLGGPHTVYVNESDVFV